MAGRKLAKAGKTELRVVFDTNVIHNRSASDVVNQDTVQLIADNAKHHDLTVVWYIPEMVRLERRYQMLKGAQDLMPSIRRMERLLSVNLAITDDILGDRVDANITKQFANLGVKSLPLDVT